MLAATSGVGAAAGGQRGMNGMRRTPAAICVPTAMPRDGTPLAQRLIYVAMRP
jgi:hypothetical protein